MLLGARLVLPRLASGAEPDVEAEPLIRPGIELRRARDDQAGVRELYKAYDLVHTLCALAVPGLSCAVRF